MSKRTVWILVAVLAVTWAAIGWLAIGGEAKVSMLGLPKQRFSHVVTEQLTVQGGGTTLKSNVTAAGYSVTADSFVGAITGNTAGVHTGAVVGNVVGNITGNTGVFTTSATAADLAATDDLDVLDDARIADALTANSATITAAVSAADVTASDDLLVGDDATVAADLLANTVAATTTVTGADLIATDDALVGDDLTVVGDALANTVAATTTVSGADVTATDDLLVGDDAAVTDALTANTGTFTDTVGAAGVTSSGNMTATTFLGALTGAVTGDVTGNTSGVHTGAVVGNVTGNVTGNTGTFTQTASIGTFLRLTPQTAITVTEGAVFTPTGSYQPIQAAGEVTPTLGTSTAGDILILQNVGAQNIQLNASATLRLKAESVTLYEHYVLGLLYDGSVWHELLVGDNVYPGD